MKIYRTFVTLEDPNQITLSSLPFEKGQRVRVVMLAEDQFRREVSQKFHQLFQTTQALPGINEITEADIAAEIDDYRQGK